MTGVLLAAGTGSRLKARTRDLPKALVRVQGKALVDYALDFMRDLPFDRLVVVVGFCADDVRKHVRERHDVVVVENPDYRKANLLTLLAAGEKLINGFSVFNVDHIYPRKLKKMYRDSYDRVTALCDFDRLLGPDDMKVATENRKFIREISKTLETFDAGYIGSTIVPPGAVKAYFEAVERVLRSLGEKAVVESVLAELAKGDDRPAVADTSGIRWLEVDDETDFNRAEETLQTDPYFLS